MHPKTSKKLLEKLPSPFGVPPMSYKTLLFNLEKQLIRIPDLTQ